jgi:hypothetical protein
MLKVPTTQRTADGFLQAQEIHESVEGLMLDACDHRQKDFPFEKTPVIMTSGRTDLGR